MSFSPLAVAGDLWLTWLVSWMMAAAWSASAVARQSLADRLAHIILISLGTILLFAQNLVGGWIGAPIMTIPPMVNWIAVTLVALGLGWSWWARIHLGRLWSANVTLKTDHSVVRSGPYAITRHPIYTGLLLAATATLVIHDTPLAVLGVVLMLIGVKVKIWQEETILTSHLGAAYTEYRKEVPALVPMFRLTGGVQGGSTVGG